LFYVFTFRKRLWWFFCRGDSGNNGFFEKMPADRKGGGSLRELISTCSPFQGYDWICYQDFAVSPSLAKPSAYPLAEWRLLPM
jgi:hypothetical protein